MINLEPITTRTILNWIDELRFALFLRYKGPYFLRKDSIEFPNWTNIWRRRNVQLIM